MKRLLLATAAIGGLLAAAPAFAAPANPTVLPTGASAAGTIGDLFGRHLSPEDKGAPADGTHDDTAAFNTLASYLSTTFGGGNIYLNPKVYVLNSANLTIPAGVCIKGDFWPGNYRKTNNFAGIPYTIKLSPSYSLLPLRNTCIQGVLLLNTNWHMPVSLADALTEISGFSGTAIASCGGSDASTGLRIRDVMFVGFANAVTSTCGNYYADHIFFDTTNGLTNPTGGDVAWIKDSEGFPWLAEGSAWNQVQWTIASMADNGSGAIRLTITPATVGGSTVGLTDATIAFTASQTVAATILSAAGITSPNGRVTISIVDNTHADVVGSSYSGTYTANSGTLTITAQERSGIAYSVQSGNGASLINDFSYGWHVHEQFGGTTQNGQAVGDRCDGTGLDPTSICYDIEGGAQNITVISDFASGHGIGAEVNSTFNGGQHTFVHPKMSSSLYTAGLTNNTLYGLRVDAGSVTVVGGAVYNNAYIGDSAGTVNLLGVHQGSSFSFTYQSAADQNKVNVLGGENVSQINLPWVIAVTNPGTNLAVLNIDPAGANTTDFLAMDQGRVMFGNDSGLDSGGAVEIGGGASKGAAIRVNASSNMHFGNGSLAAMFRSNGGIDLGLGTGSPAAGAAEVRLNDHVLWTKQTTSPTCSASTTCTPAGTDMDGHATLAAGTVTQVTVTFNLARLTGPNACIANGADSSGNPVMVVLSSAPTTTQAIFKAASSIGGGTLWWHCQ
jgi:hypothetical protein